MVFADSKTGAQEMAGIFDRMRIEAYRMPKVGNTRAHSPEIASIAVRIAAASYALTHEILPTPEVSSDLEDIPFRSLKQLIRGGEGMSDRDWYGPEGGGDSFSVSVIGGAAYGVLLGDLIFVGFRGTSELADWAINLFGLSRSGPLKIPFETEFYARRAHHFIDSNQARIALPFTLGFIECHKLYVGLLVMK